LKLRHERVPVLLAPLASGRHEAPLRAILPVDQYCARADPRAPEGQILPEPVAGLDAPRVPDGRNVLVDPVLLMLVGKRDLQRNAARRGPRNDDVGGAFAPPPQVRVDLVQVLVRDAADREAAGQRPEPPVKLGGVVVPHRQDVQGKAAEVQRFGDGVTPVAVGHDHLVLVCRERLLDDESCVGVAQLEQVLHGREVTAPDGVEHQRVQPAVRVPDAPARRSERVHEGAVHCAVHCTGNAERVPAL